MRVCVHVRAWLSVSSAASLRALGAQEKLDGIQPLLQAVQFGPQLLVCHFQRGLLVRLGKFLPARNAAPCGTGVDAALAPSPQLLGPVHLGR